MFSALAGDSERILALLASSFLFEDGLDEFGVLLNQE